MSSDKPYLCYHPESDSLFYSWEFNKGDGLVEDVTDNRKAQQEAIKRGLTIPEKPKEVVNLPRTFDNEVLCGLGDYIERGIKRAIVCCPNCDNFDYYGEQCQLNHKRPPANIIAFGCECFLENQVPF